MKFLLCAGLCLSLAAGAADAAPMMAFPGADWEEATPESQGVDGRKLEAAIRQLATTVGSNGVQELVIVRHGRMIWQGDAMDRRHGVWSATKSFTSTVLGLLIADGKCTLDTRVADVLPALKPHYADATLRHFTTMTSGYRAVGDEPVGSYKHGPSGTPFQPNPKPLFTPPGSQYAYWDSAMNTLGLALTRIAGEPLEQLFRRRVAEPIGLKNWDWGDYTTVDGVVVNGGSGNANKHVFITARDLARFGWLFLNRGHWNGRRLISAKWVAEATSVQVPATMPWAHPESEIDGRGVYGFNWWRNGLKPDGTRKFPGAPDRMFWASGHNNNKCFVIPEWDMVIVRLGLDGRAKDEVWDKFLAKVGEAVAATRKLKAAMPPYPPSPVIAAMDWAPTNQIIRAAPDGDNWPVTWADDDAIYTTWGDGTGFEPKVEKKLSLGFARVTGPPDKFSGVNVRSPAEQLGQGRAGKKGWGILCVEGVLYLWLGHADHHGATAQLAWSRDQAKTWTFADWKFAEFGLVGLVNFGKDYSGARDAFVYACSHDDPRADTPADRFILMRAPKDKLTRREAWEFFAKLDAGGQPMWTHDIRARGAVFRHPGACLRSAMTYCAPLKRYLWWQHLPQPPGATRDRGDTRFTGGFAVYDAPEPWGPWTTAFFTEQWDVGPGEHGDFPAKWMSADGRTLHLVFSGEDAFSVRQATLKLVSPPSKALPPRLLVLTDIGGDPDDQQSMVRLLVHANEFEIEGLVATASGTPGELKEKVTKPHLIRELVEAYGQVRDHLAKHAHGFPAAGDLLKVIKSGNPSRGRVAIGDGRDTEGSRWLIQCAERPDPRPLNIAIWGGQTDLAQALWRVRQDRGASGLREFQSRLRVFDIDDQDRIQDWLFAEFPGVFYVLAKAPKGADKRLGAYRGMYLGGDETLTSRAWIDAQVRTGHGPLGALYPPKTWTAPNPHSALKEGDTSSWLFFLDQGLGSAAHPEWGGWGGRYVHESRGLFRDAPDTVGKITDARAAVWRWRAAVQNDFAARLDWCVADHFKQANHPPVAVLNGDQSKRIVELAVRPGATVSLSAAGSSDPDGNTVQATWFVYPEAGTFQGGVKLDTTIGGTTRFVAPAVTKSETLHVILQVQDDGSPNLFAFRRAVITIQP